MTNCAQAKGMCHHQRIGLVVRQNCARTCGVCGATAVPTMVPTFSGLCVGFTHNTCLQLREVHKQHTCLITCCTCGSQNVIEKWIRAMRKDIGIAAIKGLWQGGKFLWHAVGDIQLKNKFGILSAAKHFGKAALELEKARKLKKLQRELKPKLKIVMDCIARHLNTCPTALTLAPTKAPRPAPTVRRRRRFWGIADEDLEDTASGAVVAHAILLVYIRCSVSGQVASSQHRSHWNMLPAALPCTVGRQGEGSSWLGTNCINTNTNRGPASPHCIKHLWDVRVLRSNKWPILLADKFPLGLGDHMVSQNANTHSWVFFK